MANYVPSQCPFVEVYWDAELEAYFVLERFRSPAIQVSEGGVPANWERITDYSAADFAVDGARYVTQVLEQMVHEYPERMWVEWAEFCPEINRGLHQLPKVLVERGSGSLSVWVCHQDGGGRHIIGDRCYAVPISHEGHVLHTTITSALTECNLLPTEPPMDPREELAALKRRAENSRELRDRTARLVAKSAVMSTVIANLTDAGFYSYAPQQLHDALRELTIVTGNVMQTATLRVFDVDQKFIDDRKLLGLLGIVRPYTERAGIEVGKTRELAYPDGSFFLIACNRRFALSNVAPAATRLSTAFDTLMRIGGILNAILTMQHSSERLYLDPDREYLTFLSMEMANCFRTPEAIACEWSIIDVPDASAINDTENR